MSSTVAATTVASIVGGETRRDAPGGRLTSTNPARTDEVVAEVLLGDASTFVDAARAARVAQRECTPYSKFRCNISSRSCSHTPLPPGRQMQTE